MLPCWAPRRVESTGDELFTLLIMASSSSNPNASQNKPKRPRENNSDTSENEHSQPTMSSASPPFLVVHSQEERSISSLSPFVIQKVLIGMAGGPKRIKKLRSGDLLVEYTNKKQIENLLRLESFHNLKVQVSLHGSLNTCKGVVRCPDLKGVSEEEILEEMRVQGVSLLIPTYLIHCDATHVKYLGIMRINAIGKRYVPTVVSLNILLMKQTVNAQQNVSTAMKTTRLTRNNARPGILKKKY